MNTIKKETKKAFLLEKNNVEFWVQKRWRKADGTLTPAGLKSFLKKKDELRMKKEFKKWMGNFRIWYAKEPSMTSPKGYARIYNGDNYANIHIAPHVGKGYIDRHRWAKGERDYKITMINNSLSIEDFELALKRVATIFLSKYPSEIECVKTDMGMYAIRIDLKDIEVIKE